VPNPNFLPYLQFKKSFTSLKDIDLFVNLKTYELKVMGLTSKKQLFDLVEIKEMFRKIESKSISSTLDKLWSGAISHREFLSVLNLSLISPKALICLSNIMTPENLIEFCLERSEEHTSELQSHCV
jgi:hypothetical protein